MNKIENHIFKWLILILVSTTYATIAIGQSSMNYSAKSKTVLTHHCQTIDDIWDFSKSYKKRHAVLTIFGIKVNDTLSIKIGGQRLFDYRVYNTDDKLQLGGIRGVMDEEYFIVNYSNKQPKVIYNSRDCSEYCIFERRRQKNECSEVEITYNGKRYVFLLQPTARWHFFFIGRDSNNIHYTARKYFTGLD